MDLTWTQWLRRLTRKFLPQTIRHGCPYPRASSLQLEELERRLTPAAPTVVSILRSVPAVPATNATGVSYQVTFSEAVTGVNTADFQVVDTGTVAGSITQVTAVNGSVYTVTIGGISGNGTLGLNLAAKNSIQDQAGEPLSPFNPAVNYNAGTSPFAVAVADLNGDGRPDLIVANLLDNDVGVMLGNGDGTFQAEVTYATVSEPATIAVGDLNGDGHLDLVVGTANASEVSVLLGNGNGTFQNAIDYATASRPESVAVADVNGDGHPDIITANVNSTVVSVLLGNGDGTFQAAVDYTAGTQPRAVAVADVNGDGHPDLVVANQGSTFVSVLLNNGNGTFQNPVNYASGNNPDAVAVADLNGDGHPDIVVANNGSNNVSVLLNNGNGTFQSAVNYPVGSQPTAVSVADINGDGHPDLVVANFGANTVSVLLGNGNGTFQPAYSLGIGSEPEGVAVADLNDDGGPDIVTANYGSDNTSVLLGNANATGQVYTIDQTAPTVSLTAPANSSALSTDEPTFSGSAGLAAGDLPTITIKIYSGSSATGTLVQTLTTTGVGSYAVAPTTPLANGTYTAQASQSDDAGNTGLSGTTTFSVSVVPTISSLTTNTFVVGIASTFTVVANGTPTPTLSESGTLPTGVTFNTATGVLGGTPAAGTAGSYPITFTATNSTGSSVPQQFTLTVATTAAAPVITSGTSAAFAAGMAGSFTVTTTGAPTPTLTESGFLPSGVTFNPTTDVLGGTPAPGNNGSYSITFSANNGVGSTITQNFLLTVNSPVDELGAYRASTGSWSLDSDGTPGFTNATDQVFYSFSPPGVTGVAGDWTGSGHTDIGDFSNGVWHLDLNDNGVLDPGETFNFGQAGDQPVVGDWTGNGVTNIGVFRAAPDGITGEFILDTNGDHLLDTGDTTFTFGLASDRIVIGDWNGAGKDEVGVFRNAASFNAADAGDAVFTLDVNGDHAYDAGDQVFVFGLISDGLIVGDWNGAGKSEVGVYRDGSTAPVGNPLYAPGTALFSLDTNGDHQFDAGDAVFLYGLESDQFLSGHWAKTPPKQPEGSNT